MLKKHVKILVVATVVLMSHFFMSSADANIDGSYCVGTQGYVFEKTTDISCTGNGLPSGCAAGQGLHYPGSPYACSAGETVVGHHFTMTCPTCTPPCSPAWGSWSACSVSCGGGTQSRQQTCTGTWDSRSCNTQSCCVNSATYGACSKSCGTGTQSYKDTCTGTTHTRNCNAHACPSCESGYDATLCGLQNEILTIGSCANGVAGNFGGAGTNNNPWIWTCDGSGLSESCCAKINAGSCGADNNTVYTYPQANFVAGFDFCNPDSAVSTPAFVNLTQLDVNNPVAVTTKWSCNTVNGGTKTEACNATLNPPTVACGSENNENVTNTKPSGNGLCQDASNNVNPPVTLATGGRWTWGCRHNVFTGITANCSTPSCISNAVSATSPIMLSDNMNSTVSVSCPGSNLCCEITSDRGVVPITVCSGHSNQIEIEPGQNNLSSICWFEDCDPNTGTCPTTPTCNGNTEECVNGLPTTVQTMCTVRECNAQGTCQTTPQLGAIQSDCSSTCNSNADCSSGRMIETRP